VVEREEVTEKPVGFSAAELRLEGVMHLPTDSGPFPAVVVCHPHPLYGGDMDNNVVRAIASALHEASMAVLRFNFRGVGRSQGEFSDGLGEQEDLRSALAFLSSQAGVDPDRIGLAGYSFGAKIALSVALLDQRLAALALVSPFTSDEEWDQLTNARFPTLVISGSEDDFISPHRLRRLSEAMPPGPVECEIVLGVDHFWWGHESKLARRAKGFFSSHLQTRDTSCSS
jgi:alpha/beta superfamily hydrolase